MQPRQVLWLGLFAAGWHAAAHVPARADVGVARLTSSGAFDTSFSFDGMTTVHIDGCSTTVIDLALAGKQTAASTDFAPQYFTHVLGDAAAIDPYRMIYVGGDATLGDLCHGELASC